MHNRSAIVLLNVAHAVDHMFLLIFATAVASIEAESASRAGRPGAVRRRRVRDVRARLVARGAFGDLWGRRAMMVVFFFGMGASSLLASAAPLTAIGTFASIDLPVGISMLLQSAARQGATIGVNGLSGKLAPA